MLSTEVGHEQAMSVPFCYLMFLGRPKITRLVTERMNC